jgi:hypothetical protein
MPIENIALFFRGLLTDRGPFKAALNALVAEERALEGLGPNVVLRAFKAASRHIHARQDVPLIVDRGRNTCSPSPRISVLRG